jgi:hypothetical protein
MEQWEYMTREVSSDALDAQLNAFAAHGWEVVNVTLSGLKVQFFGFTLIPSRRFLVIVKRRKP